MSWERVRSWHLRSLCRSGHFSCPQTARLQESCLYPRLNAALRNHDTRSLEPFLPYMKLLLSALYQLPLVHVRTYRGVKLELFEVSGYRYIIVHQ